MFSVVSSEDKPKKDRFAFATAILGLSGSAGGFGTSKMKVNSGGGEADATYELFTQAYQYRWIKPINEERVGNHLPPFNPRLDEHFFHLDYRSNNISEFTFLRKLSTSEHGDFLSIDTGWEGHAIGMNFVVERTEDNKLVTHMIVVNGGERSNPKEKDGFLNGTIQCYSMEHPLNVDFLRYIYRTCTGEMANNQKSIWVPSVSSAAYVLTGKQLVRESFDQLFHALDEVRNYELSAVMPKSMQKGGNCGIANLNQSMHFSLASETMRREPEKGLKEAYDETLHTFKQIRMNARMNALRILLNMRSDFSNEVQWLGLVIEAMGKFASKEKRAAKKRDPAVQSMDSIFQMIKTEFPSHYESIVNVIQRNFDCDKLREKIDATVRLRAATKMQLSDLSLSPSNNKEREKLEVKIAQLEFTLTVYEHQMQIREAYDKYLKSPSLESKHSADVADSSAPVVLHTQQPTKGSP